MTLYLNLAEVPTELADLIRRGQLGEEVIILEGGREIARIVPASPPAVGSPRVPGCDRGKIAIAPDFEELPEDWPTELESGSIEPTDGYSACVAACPVTRFASRPF